jgi:hypothetical protein
VEIDPSYLRFSSNWSSEERKAGRRLMQISFEIHENVLYISCHPAPHKEYPDNTERIISMLHFRRGAVLFTSVDFIRIVEWIGCCQFYASEKGRIRRRIPKDKYDQCEDRTISDQGTVLKSADLSSFYNRIMSYENPKVVKIRKAVKVFPWSRLGPMLEKAFRDYVSLPSYFKMRLLKYEYRY